MDVSRRFACSFVIFGLAALLCCSSSDGGSGDGATCAAGQIMCGGACVASDANNCGACGTVCAQGASCAPSLDGKLTCQCPVQMIPCNGICLDYTNASACGDCNTQCAAGEACVAGSGGAYGCECASPNVICGTTCSDPSTDVANCGMCGKACEAGEICQLGACKTAPPDAGS